MSSCSRSFRIFAGRGSTRAHFCEYADVHDEARWGRAWQGRCRMKSRSDTTPAHSIITKPRDPPTICPPILSPSPFYALSLSLRCVCTGMKDTTPWRTNARIYNRPSTLARTRSFSFLPLSIRHSSSFSPPYPFLLSPSLFTSVTAIHPSTQFRAYWRCPSSPLLRKM